MCYQSQCIDSSLILNSIATSDPCQPNPCKNQGICTKNGKVSGFVCNCPSSNSFAGNTIFNLELFKLTLN